MPSGMLVSTASRNPKTTSCSVTRAWNASAPGLLAARWRMAMGEGRMNAGTENAEPASCQRRSASTYTRMTVALRRASRMRSPSFRSVDEHELDGGALATRAGPGARHDAGRGAGGAAELPPPPRGARKRVGGQAPPAPRPDPPPCPPLPSPADGAQPVHPGPRRRHQNGILPAHLVG